MSSLVPVADICGEVEEKLSAFVIKPETDISEVPSKNIDDDLPTGKILKLSKFSLQLQGKIGRGTFGTIHSVFNLDKNRQMALKVIKVQNEKEKSVCQTEANILMDLTLKSGRKSHFPFYFGNFLHGNSSCILMEKLDCDMYRIMKKRIEPLPVKTCIYLAYQVLSALRDLNELGFAHTDIKPENVMLIDVGVVVKIDKMKKSIGTEIQTYEYRAPEVVFGLPMDETVDTWSVGVMIAEFYTKTELFVVNGEKELARQIVNLVGMPTKIAECVYFMHYFRKETNEKGEDEIKFRPIKSDPIDKMIYKESGLSNITQFGLKQHKFDTITPIYVKFASFVSLLMNVDANKRPNPEQALEHSIFDDFTKLI